MSEKRNKIELFFRRTARATHRACKKHWQECALIAILFALVFGAYLASKSPQLSPPDMYRVEAPSSEIVWGDRSAKQVIFTFDGGASAESGEGILSALKKHGITGTFFLTGKFAEENPELVKKIAREGHEIFNHTYSHPNLTTLSDEEIKNELARADSAIQNLTGKSTKPYFRAPYGARDERVLAAAAVAGYQSVYWTVDVLDWKESQGFTAADAKARIVRNLAPGAIFLMHIGDGITGAILNEVFTEIETNGYVLASLIGAQRIARTAVVQ